MRRPLVVVLAMVAAVATLAGLAPPASAAPVTYIAPVSAPVVDRFRPPATPYGPGNRGLTYGTSSGTPVLASAPGRVTFAGPVAGALHVVVQHADGVRTSYSFLRTVSVRAGQLVDQGTVVGASGTNFHFGARIGDAYIDPAILLDSSPGRVHLVPDGEFNEAGAHHDGFALARIVADSVGTFGAAALGWARDAGRAASSAARAVAEVTDAAAAAVGQLGATGVALSGDRLVDLLDKVANLGQHGGEFATLAAALATIIEAARRDCTPAAVAAPKPPARRIAVFVGGLGSKGDNRLSTRMNATALGYAPDAVLDFSYRGGRRWRNYSVEDTTVDLRTSARRLRDRLDQIARDNPGVPVDLIAHSQGGLVVREALWHEYDGADHRLPPIAHVVTLGTPHHGADVATAAARILWGVPVKGKAGRQLAETSDFIRRLNRRPLPPGVRFTSIASHADAVVAAPRSRLHDATNVVINGGGGLAHAHDRLPSSAAARREVALAVADRPPTCEDLAGQLANALTGSAIATAEDRIGNAVAPRP